VRYVDAGYAVALVALALYAVSLLWRRRRWTRAWGMTEPAGNEGEAVPCRGGRP
jgi:hypothetical protein